MTCSSPSETSNTLRSLHKGLDDGCNFMPLNKLLYIKQRISTERLIQMAIVVRRRGCLKETARRATDVVATRAEAESNYHASIQQ